jgi:hypothetical protein
MEFFRLLRAAVMTLNRNTRIKDAMLLRGLDLAASFSIVGLIYSAAQLSLDLSLGIAPTTKTLLLIEQKAIWLRQQENPLHLVLPPSAAIGFLIVFSLTLATALVPWLKRRELVSRWQAVTRALGRVYLLVSIVASITFFGNERGAAIEAHRARWNAEAEVIRKDYSDAHRKIEESLATGAARDILRQIPPVDISALRDFASLRAAALKSEEALNGLRKNFTSAQMRSEQPPPAQQRAGGARTEEGPPSSATEERVNSTAESAAAVEREAEHDIREEFDPLQDAWADLVRESGTGGIFKGAAEAVGLPDDFGEWLSALFDEPINGAIKSLSWEAARMAASGTERLKDLLESAAARLRPETGRLAARAGRFIRDRTPKLRREMEGRKQRADARISAQAAARENYVRAKATSVALELQSSCASGHVSFAQLERLSEVKSWLKDFDSELLLFDEPVDRLKFLETRASDFHWQFEEVPLPGP